MFHCSMDANSAESPISRLELLPIMGYGVASDIPVLPCGQRASYYTIQSYGLKDYFTEGIIDR